MTTIEEDIDTLYGCLGSCACEEEWNDGREALGRIRAALAARGGVESDSDTIEQWLQANPDCSVSTTFRSGDARVALRESANRCRDRLPSPPVAPEQGKVER